MKVELSKDHFCAGLQQVLNVVGAKTALPILNNVLIKTEEDRVSLTTTNLDMGIRCTIKAKVELPGTITLPVKKLFSIVKALPASTLILDVPSKDSANITSGGSKFKIVALAEEDFPALPSFSESQSFTLDQDEFSRMLRSVSYAQSTDENRHILNGVYFGINDENLTLVATDGRRLALSEKKLDGLGDYSGNFIVPAKTVGELLRVLGCGQEIKISFNERQVAFELSLKEEDAANGGLCEGIYLVSKTVEGNYPNYKQVIPKETEHRIKIERELLQDCIQRASLVAADKNSSVKIRVSSNLLEIFGFSQEFGESHESMAVAYDGPEVQVAFNPQFLIDPLKSVPKDEMYFEFKDDLSPGMFKTTERFVCVVMPLRLN